MRDAEPIIPPGGLQTPEVRERVARAFRYAQVGRCVNSVTHDINNQLGAILAFTDLMELNPNLTAESQRMLEQIGSAVQKCSSLISSLTTIARKERPDASIVDMAQVVSHVLDIRQYDFRISQVPLESVCDGNIPSVVIDLPRVEMALIYLLTNALEATQGVPSPRVRIRTRDLKEAVEVTVWNSGPAIPASAHEVIFDPFYTTKGEDHLGLGLTLARETARAHDGDLSYDPKQGFVLRIPCANRFTLEEAAQTKPGD